MRAVLLLAIVLCALHGCLATALSDVLQRANAALASYDYAGALDAFNTAVEMDPSSYLVYFRRATAQQALGRTSAALADLDATIERNPAFTKAYLQRARIHLREGNLIRARDELRRLDAQLQKTNLAGTDINDIATLRARIIHAIDLEQQLSKKLAAPKCVDICTELLDAAPNHVSARLKRAECEMERGNTDVALTDWGRAAILSPSAALHLRLSFLSYYVFGTRDSQIQDSGLAQLRACLHSDPDNKQCIRAHKQLRRIDKALTKARKFSDDGKWVPVISALKGAKVGGPTVRDDVEEIIKAAEKTEIDGEPLLPPSLGDPLKRSELLVEIDTLYCRAYGSQEKYAQAIPFCDRVLEHSPNNIYALVIKGEDHIANGNYKDGNALLSRAYEASGRSNDIFQRLQRGQKLERLANHKNYYKVLEVPRDADERTIKKAYRRLAREHHPDKGGNEEKMTEINEAFGVLSNPELRAQYDQGNDPNDPMAAAGGDAGAHAGNPFAQFFQQAAFQQQFQQQFRQPFGGGQQFHFNF
ncbi:hypothetical protein MCUN1_003284 [Malassezia cuniculi]|uniref:J domain-containing protein n=1 Tax=Malassezia cuniculi TaxID=948313 RepID=A0AAF0J7T6_9BASI|nr:hypothetical protein MCUN1_003284 [Malassezia cuniculi]